MGSICKYNRPDCYGAKELDFLLDLSSLLSNKDINLDEVIGILAEHLTAERIILTVFEPGKFPHHYRRIVWYY